MEVAVEDRDCLFLTNDPFPHLACSADRSEGDLSSPEFAGGFGVSLCDLAGTTADLPHEVVHTNPRSSTATPTLAGRLAGIEAATSP